jgi:hypothetical protein
LRTFLLVGGVLFVLAGLVSIPMTLTEGLTKRRKQDEERP